MTQLIISGTEAVLPLSFACTVKRENSFFTKSGEYTYDCTLHLDNPTNQELYGFLGRTNKSGQIDTGRSAVLIADGHVYCRGTEIVTRWTDDTVTIQIVSGESELNYFMNQEQKLEDLDLGVVTADGWTEIRRKHRAHLTDNYNYNENYCTPPIRLNNGTIVNWERGNDNVLENLYPQPYLIPLLQRLFTRLGYRTVNLQALRGYDYLFLVNTIHTKDYGVMFAGWKAIDLITAVEQLTGCVFVVNATANSITAVQKCNYFQDADRFTLRNVIDEYETEVLDADSQDDADWASSNVRYDLPDNNASKLLELSDEIKALATITDYAGIAAIKAAIAAYSTYTEAAAAHVIYHDTSTDRYYIAKVLTCYDLKVIETRDNDGIYYQVDSLHMRNGAVPIEVNMCKELHRSDAAATIEIAITPAPMKWVTPLLGCEIIDLKDSGDSGSEESEETEDTDFTGFIESYSNKEASTRHIYAAFFSGMYDYVSIAYTDQYHAYRQKDLYDYTVTDSPTESNDYYYEGSLRLQDIEDEMYGNDYGIDTAHAMTFETYDPNVIDPRQVYIIKNRPYVVRDIEESITAEGRRKNWKLTCYPLKVEDVSVADRWVLERGGWDDGAAWLDDGRWNDDPL